MSNPNDPNDPETGRGKKEDGWKTVVIKSPFIQGNQDPQAAQGAPGQPPPGNFGQPQGGYAPPPPAAQAPTPQPPQFPPAPQPPAPAAPSFDKTQVYTHAPFATPPTPPASSPSSDKTQVYTTAQFPPAPQNPASPPSAAPQGYPPPPPAPGGFTPPAPGGGGYTPPPPPGGYPPGAVRPPQGQPFPQQYGAPPKKKSKTWLWILLGVLGFILLCIVGCIGFFYSKVKKGLNRPDVAIVMLHTRMAMHQDAKIFESADDKWKSSVPRATSDAMFDQVGQQLGTPSDYEIIGTPTDLGGDLVQVEVRTTFTQGTATETIVFHKTALGLKLYHYSIHASGVETNHERVLNP